MGKNQMMAVLVALLTICFAASSFAVDKGDERKGKYTYRNVYKTCHERGAVESPKPPLGPDSKTMSQWEEVFKNKAFDDFGCKEEWGKLSDQDLSDILAYLYGHAADSPSPAKCK
jgi:hypothetical protein